MKERVDTSKEAKEVMRRTLYSGPALRRLRKARGLTQKDFGEKAGGLLSVVISAYEREDRTPSVEALAMMLEAADCDLNRWARYVEAAHRQGSETPEEQPAGAQASQGTSAFPSGSVSRGEGVSVSAVFALLGDLHQRIAANEEKLDEVLDRLEKGGSG